MQQCKYLEIGRTIITTVKIH